ncbi:MAG: hypothetical protein CM15mP129_05660 [Chloroflexota bacterium]|nr:MAG: hypothetical protein CM15mP129_05660 [Chloroflexota bacterium]
MAKGFGVQPKKKTRGGAIGRGFDLKLKPFNK